MTTRYTGARRRMRQRRLKRTLITVLGLIFLSLAGFGGYSLANSSLFDLKEIRLEGNAVLTRDEIVELSGLRIGTNMLKISPKQAEENILTQPYVKEAEVSRGLIHAVDIRISERSAAALLSGGDRYLLIDGEGCCLEELGLVAAESRALPVIRVSAGAMALAPGGITEDEGILAALALIDKLDPFFMENIREFDAPSAERLAVINIDGLPVYFGPPENLDRKLQMYEELLIKNREQCNVQTLNYVDLRYDTQPILSKK